MASIDVDKFNRYVNERLITRRKHPVVDLYIWNYTPLAQFGKNWDEVTLASRGLITDFSGNIVARPFNKFFNYGEYKGEIPQTDFSITEKMDGSLGILYKTEGGYAIATRGSFESDQAIHATALLDKYIDKNGTDWIKSELTYLFEIIYPSNRIVVDYGKRDELVLLATIDTETGQDVELDLTDWKGTKPQEEIGTKDFAELRRLNVPNHEGFVILFKTGLRLKVKFDEYMRLHRILTAVSTKDIWKYIAVGSMREMLDNDAKKLGDALNLDRNIIQGMLDSGDGIEKLLEKVPDEFYAWVNSVKNDIVGKHDQIIATAAAVYDKVNFMERPMLASAVKGMDKTVVAIVWALLDEKAAVVQSLGWKYAYPEHEKPFKEDIDG